jgi:hypothetical protein
MLLGELRTKIPKNIQFCLYIAVFFGRVTKVGSGRKGDEQLLALWDAAQGAQALLALQASLVLWR